MNISTLFPNEARNRGKFDVIILFRTDLTQDAVTEKAWAVTSVTLRTIPYKFYNHH